MATIQLENEVVKIPELRADGQNWPVYCERLERALTGLGAVHYLNGTTPDPYDAQTNSFVKCSIASTIPNSLFSRILHIESARECFATLRSLFEPTTTTTSTVIDIWSNNVTREAARTSNDACAYQQAREKSREQVKVKNGSGKRKRDVPSKNETRRSRERKRNGQRSQEVDDEGEKSCGRVGKEVAAAGGSGEEATNQRADGVSLATPASSPERNHSKVEPPPVESNPNEESRTTHAIWTPSETDSRGEGQGVDENHNGAAGACDEAEKGENDEEDGRVDTSTDETAATTTTTASEDANTPSVNENQTENSPEDPQTRSMMLEGEKVESSGSSIELTSANDASRASRDADDDVNESPPTSGSDDDERHRSYIPNEIPKRSKPPDGAGGPESRENQSGGSKESEDVMDVANDDDDDAKTVSEAVVEPHSPVPPPEPPDHPTEPPNPTNDQNASNDAEDSLRHDETRPNEPPAMPNEVGKATTGNQEAEGGQGGDGEWKVEVDETRDGVDANCIPTPQTTQANDPATIQVEPGGETKTDEENTYQGAPPHLERAGSIVHECRRKEIIRRMSRTRQDVAERPGNDGTDQGTIETAREESGALETEEVCWETLETVDEGGGMLRDEHDEGETVETCRNASLDGEKWKTSERGSRDQEDRQHETANDDDVPRTSTHLPPPFPTHHERSRIRTNERRDENEPNARCNSTDARAQSCGHTVATRARRVEQEHLEGIGNEEDDVPNASSRSKQGRSRGDGRERPKDERQMSRDMTKEVEGQGEYWRGEKCAERDGEHDGSDDTTSDYGRDSGGPGVESQKILADGRRDQRYKRKLVMYSPRPSPPHIPHHAKHPVKSLNPPRRRGCIKPSRSRTRALAYANLHLRSRRDHHSATDSRDTIQRHRRTAPSIPITRTKDAEAANSIPHHPAVPRAVH